MNKKISMADLHVHSRYSNRPSEWLLRRIGAPECYVKPVDIYNNAKKAGMQFVTITDHNNIHGALEIADLPDTFISVELTSYFPDDSCKIHCLAYDITPAQFNVLDELRENVYDLRQYLVEQNITHSLAHMMYSVNNKTTLEHVEKLLVLFNTFEVLNGTRNFRANNVLRQIFANLTPEIIARLADKHGITPVGKTPWVKNFTGGSDDHSGVYGASAFTTTPFVKTPAEFLQQVTAGNSDASGECGGSLKLAHSLYHIAYDYYKERFSSNSKQGLDVLESLFGRLSKGVSEKKKSGKKKKKGLVKKFVTYWKSRNLSPIEKTLIKEFSALSDNKKTENENDKPADRNFALACRLSQQLGYAIFTRFMDHANRGRLIGSLEDLAALCPIGLCISPYFAAFRAQHKDQKLIKSCRGEFLPNQIENDGIAWVTDTFEEVNGVAQTIKTLGKLAVDLNRPLTIITSTENEPDACGANVKNFKPVGKCQVPEYDKLELRFPAFLEMINYIEKNNFKEIIISTPGPVGFVGLVAAKLLNIKATGIYHTDFPHYVRLMTEDESLEKIAWKFMLWFYGNMDRVLAPSEWYRRQLEDYGLDVDDIQVMPRGIDAVNFNPSFRKKGFWKDFGARHDFTFAYVGRVSVEKNIKILVEAFRILRKRGVKANLGIVGGGPYYDELVKECRKDKDIILTGFMGGTDLVSSYASSEVFVFPSKTDTFGNVVLEAQACGLPAIVSNTGGPREIVRPHNSGVVISMDDAEELADAMEDLFNDKKKYKQLAEQALVNAERSGWWSILDMVCAPVKNCGGDFPENAA